MSPTAEGPSRPDWDALYQAAEGQAGYFTLAQAQACGYSSQALHKHLAGQRIERVRRGIYRLRHFPMTENEELVVLWLWSDRTGVFSHETSLFLHELSDVMPGKVHMTLPSAWRKRRLRVPEGLVLHFEDLAQEERAWVDVAPVTIARMALKECIDSGLSREWIEQAIDQAERRGMIVAREAAGLRKRTAREDGGDP